MAAYAKHISDQTHLMSRCSSLAITLMALISVSKSEWYPPQCAILRSPCSTQSGNQGVQYCRLLPGRRNDNMAAPASCTT